MTIRLLSTVGVAVLVFLSLTLPASALEFLFTREYYEKPRQEPVQGIAIYERGTVGRHHGIIERPARYRWRTRRVMVRPPYTTYRIDRRGRRRVVRRHRAEYRTIRERVMVRPVRYRARFRRGRPGYVRRRAIVYGYGPFTKPH